MCLGQGCPNCWPPEECERCYEGVVYYVLDPDTGEKYECTPEEYGRTPEEYRDCERCPHCNGEGVIW